MVAAALAVFAFPPATRLLEYDRLRVVGGEWWRVFTGHWVHFGARELAWNVGVILAAGIWAERLLPLRARLYYLVAPILVGGILHALFPEVSRYAGLSAVAAGIVAFLALAQLRLSTADRWFWRFVLGLLVLKVGAEAVAASSWFSPVPDPAARLVPIIHMAGITAGAIVLTARRRSS